VTSWPEPCENSAAPGDAIPCAALPYLALLVVGLDVPLFGGGYWA